MNGVRRIATNTATLTLAEIISKLSFFFIFVYIARFLGNVAFGKFNFAYSFALIAVVFMDIGINYMIVREISRKKKSTGEYTVNALIVKSVFSVFILSLVYWIINTLNYPPETKILVYLLCIFIFIRSLTELLFSVFKAHEKMHYEASIKIGGMLLLLIAGISLLALGQSVVILALVFVLTEILVFISSLIIVNLKFTKLKLVFDYKISKDIIKKAIPFTLSLISATIYFNIAVIMLSLMKGDAAVGAYSAAYNLTMAVLVIPGMYSFAIYPVFSKYFKEHKKKVVFIYERSFKYLYLIGLPISIGAFILARNIILFIYGAEFGASILALKILAWFVFIKFASYLTGILLSSAYKQHLRMYAQVTTAIANIILNFVLIPKYGIVGACIATIVCEALLFIITFFFVSKTVHSLNILSIMHKPLIASILMSSVIIYLNMNLILSILLGFVIYFSALIILKTFDRRDYVLLSKLLKNE